MNNNNTNNINKHSGKLLRFATVGIIGTALHYAVLIFLVEVFQVNSVFATSTGFVIGAISNYFLSFKLVFRSNKKHQDTLPKFIVIAFITGILNSATMWALTEHLYLYYLIAQIIATGAAFILNYILNNVWTFR